MPRSPFIQTTLLCVVIATAIIACLPQTNLQQQKRQEDAWLAQNLSKPQPPVEPKPAIKTDYFNEILAGQLVVGMSLQDVIAGTQREPFGREKHPLIFWCDQQLATHCTESCHVCSALMLLPEQMLLLRGRGVQLNLEKTMARSSVDNEKKLRAKNLNVILGIFTNQVVTGMSATDFERIEFAPQTRKRFFCDGVRSFSNCLRQCAECRIDLILPQNDRYLLQSVLLNGTYDFQSVVQVNVQEVDSID